MTIRQNRVSKITARAAVLTFFVAASSLCLNAQQSAGTVQSLPALKP